MNGFIDILLLLGQIDTVVEQLSEDLTNQSRDIRGLVSDEFEKCYKPSDTALNYFD